MCVCVAGSSLWACLLTDWQRAAHSVVCLDYTGFYFDALSGRKKGTNKEKQTLNNSAPRLDVCVCWLDREMGRDTLHSLLRPSNFFLAVGGGSVWYQNNFK